MSTLLVVRHAQASLFADDYDKLSEQGYRQSELLREFVDQQQIHFAKVFIGPRLRHRQTAETALPRLTENQSSLIEIPELDEHHVDQLVSQHAAEIGKRFPRVADAHARFRSAESDQQRRRGFAILFEEVANLWVAGQCPLYGIESWQDFCLRVNSGIDTIVSSTGKGQDAIVFTSAGTIAATLLRALKCPDAVALGLGWRLWNCSITRYAFSANRFSLDQFNTLPHMPDQADWTYR